MNLYLKKCLENIGALLAATFLIAALTHGVWFIGRECYKEGMERQKLQHIADMKEMDMNLAYTDKERIAACRKAEATWRFFNKPCVVVRRRIGVRDGLPQGYVVLSKDQVQVLGLGTKEYVTVYDTEATAENR